jgi:hypothetical protein
VTTPSPSPRVRDAVVRSRLLALPPGERTLAALRSLCDGDAAMVARLWEQVERAATPRAATGGLEFGEELARSRHSVVRAATTADGRPVVVKSPSAACDRDQAARFQADANQLSRFDHPNVIRYLSIDAGPSPSITMERAARSLADRLAAAEGHQLSPTESAEVVRDAGRGVGYAHQHGIIHRDLKPSNILLVEEPGGGEVPKVADFGIAKFPAAGGPVTEADAVLGTGAYMPPEQLGRAAQADARSDVYGLGAVLYECLTGRPPFTPPSDDPADVYRQVREELPLPVRRLNPDVPTDLATVCQKCLEKNPARRYASAAALVADLDLFLSGRRVAARPPGRLAGGVGGRPRHPREARLVSLSAALAALLVVLLVAAAVYYRGVTGRLTTLVGERDSEIAGRKVVQYLSGLVDASVELSENQDYDRATRVLTDCPDEHRGWEFYHLKTWASDPTRRVVVAGAGAADPSRGNWMVATSPTGTRVAAATINEGVVVYRPDGTREAVLSELPVLPALGGRTMSSRSPG